MTPKPCPFCGSTDLSEHTGFITCNACQADGPTKPDIARASAAWNTRRSGTMNRPPLEYWQRLFEGRLVGKVIDYTLWLERQYEELRVQLRTADPSWPVPPQIQRCCCGATHDEVCPLKPIGPPPAATQDVLRIVKDAQNGRDDEPTTT